MSYHVNTTIEISGEYTKKEEAKIKKEIDFKCDKDNTDEVKKISNKYPKIIFSYHIKGEVGEYRAGTIQNGRMVEKASFTN